MKADPPEDFPKPMLNSVPKGEYSGVSAILVDLGGPRKFHHGMPSFLTEPEIPLQPNTDDATDKNNKRGLEEDPV